MYSKVHGCLKVSNLVPAFSRKEDFVLLSPLSQLCPAECLCLSREGSETPGRSKEGKSREEAGCRREVKSWGRVKKAE